LPLHGRDDDVGVEQVKRESAGHPRHR